MTEGAPLPQQMHKHTGGPLHIPSLTMETPEQHSIVMDIRDQCVCEGCWGRWKEVGCCCEHAEDTLAFLASLWAHSHYRAKVTV